MDWRAEHLPGVLPPSYPHHVSRLQVIASHFHYGTEANGIGKGWEEIENETSEFDEEQVLSFLIEEEYVVEITLGKDDLAD